MQILLGFSILFLYWCWHRRSLFPFVFCRVSWRAGVSFFAIKCQKTTCSHALTLAFPGFPGISFRILASFALMPTWWWEAASMALGNLVMTSLILWSTVASPYPVIPSESVSDRNNHEVISDTTTFQSFKRKCITWLSHKGSYIKMNKQTFKTHKR